MPFLILVLAVLAGAAGCLSTTFQEVTYSGDALEVSVENTDKPVENAVLQVTIMKVGRSNSTKSSVKHGISTSTRGRTSTRSRWTCSPARTKSF